MSRRCPLDIVDDRVRFVRAAMDHQPAGAFRNPHPHHEDDQAESCADEVSQPPAEIGRQHVGIEQHDGGDRADRSPDPEAAADHQISPAAIARRHQFLDRRIDRGIFAADPRPGEEPKQRVTRHIPRQRGSCRRGEIERERNEEQFLATEPVRSIAKKKSAKDRAC